MKCKISLQR